MGTSCKKAKKIVSLSYRDPNFEQKSLYDYVESHTLTTMF